MRLGPIQPGDLPSRSSNTQSGRVVECEACGFVFVLRRSNRGNARCRRCERPRLSKWRPGAGAGD